MRGVTISTRETPITHHSSLITSDYRAPGWLPGGHAQTLYAALALPRARITYRRERWDTPDGDFIDLDWAETPSLVNGLGNDNANSQASASAALAPPGVASPEGPLLHPSTLPHHSSRTSSVPLLVLFHGLEGSSHSHYSLALMAAARARGLRGVVVHFRGCSGEPNRLARAYHSGDAREIDWILRRLRAQNATVPFYAAGVSLGGNALLKWLGETGTDAGQVINRAAAVSAPLDLMAAGDALERGFSMIYTRNFLSTLRCKSLSKLDRHPGLYDAAKVGKARTLREFDDLVTAPLHGYRNTDDYWTRASSKPGLKDIQVPTLVLNARNDPFLPATALPDLQAVSVNVTLEQPEDGGHVGFVGGTFPGNFDWLPQRLLDFLNA